jgi:hypothetical protein
VSKKKVTGSLSVSINFECPKCEAWLDAFSEEETGVVNDEGQLWEVLTTTGGEGAWSKLGFEVTCYKCKHEFLFDEMEY